MRNKEEQSQYCFPKGTDPTFLGKLEQRYIRTSSLRTTVAHALEEEGLWLREVARKFLPDDLEAKIAIDGYASVGTIILETESAMQSENYKGGKFMNLLNSATGEEYQRYFQEENQVRLLQRDSRGFELIKWWVELSCKDNKNMNKTERQAILIGRANGMRRYKELYTAINSTEPTTDF